MQLSALIRRQIKAARARGALWVRLVDIARFLPHGEGRARLWTQFTHPSEIHQTSPDTEEERYPDLFDFAASICRAPRRILSFGCSTGEELVSLRRRFPNAEIVGAEINPRSRRLADRRMARDPRTWVVSPEGVRGAFDLIFGLAVFQREPHKIAEMDVADLTPFYPFDRFDKGIGELVDRLIPGGILCIVHAHYRVEDSLASPRLEPIAEAPGREGLWFGPDGKRVTGATAATMFRKRGQASD